METANQCLPTEEMLAKKLLRAESRTSLEKLGLDVSGYGLVTTLVLIGVLKFTTGNWGFVPNYFQALGGHPQLLQDQVNLFTHVMFQDENAHYPAS